MLDGFAFCQMIFDENSKPVDFVYLEINDAFERITGLKRENVVGKRVTEAIPGIEKANPELLEIYGRVALTGNEEKFEIFFKPLSLWLSVSVTARRRGILQLYLRILLNVRKLSRSFGRQRTIGNALLKVSPTS